MTYDSFKQAVLERLSNDIPDPKTITIQSVPKNNGTILDGLVIMENDINISPTIYLDHYYFKHQQGQSFQMVYDNLINDYHCNKPKEAIDVEFFTNFDYTRDRIMLRLIHYEKNKQLLEDLPHIRYLDLAIVFYCLIPLEQLGDNGTILIHNDHLSYWNIDTQELYQIAMKNSMSQLVPQLHNLNQIASASLFDSDDSDFRMDQELIPNIYILTNRYNLYGSACILYNNLLESLASHFHLDLYILPSSIHEVLIIPATDAYCLSELSEMVQDVNNIGVLSEEVLSDHAYLYSRSEKKILM